MKSQLSWDRFFMDFAGKCAELSHDPKTKVGCVLVRDDNILSFSYNGTPRGQDNTMRNPDGSNKPNVIHAEMGAISKMIIRRESPSMCTAYITRAPCLDCAKLLYASGIVRVVYRDDHSCNLGKEFLRGVYIACMSIT